MDIEFYISIYCANVHFISLYRLTSPLQVMTQLPLNKENQSFPIPLEFKEREQAMLLKIFHAMSAVA